MHMAALSHHFMRRSCTPCHAFWRKSQTSVVDVPWVAEPLWPASMPCLSHRKPSMRSSVDAMACTTTCLSVAQLASGMVHHAWSDPTASHCETGRVFHIDQVDGHYCALLSRSPHHRLWRVDSTPMPSSLPQLRAAWRQDTTSDGTSTLSRLTGRYIPPPSFPAR